jgi:hypothetical protein
MSSSNSILLQYDFSNASFFNGVLNDLSNNNLNANMSQYNYIGCYNDTGNRAIPTQMPNVPNEQGCQQYAIENNASIFGLQYYGQCFIGNNINQAKEYGPASNCPSMGGAWTNQVYSRSYNNPSLNQPGPTQILKSALFNVNEQQYITVPAFTTPTNGLSFSFWFQSNNNSTWARIFDFGNGAASDNIIAYINNGNLGLSVYIEGSSTQNDNVIPNVNDNVWRHIVWTLDPSGVWNLYLNGNLYNIYPNVNFPNANYPRSISRNNQYIGRSNWCSSTCDPYYNGNIADFRVFNGVLSASSITNIYNAPNSNYWKYTPSIGNPIKLFQNNYVTNWANLNITSNTNMSVSFTINIENINPNWRNIFHVTNTNNDCCNSGDRVPAVWITDGGQSLLIVNSINSDGNSYFYTGNIQLNIPTKVDIIWNAQNVTVYFNEVLNIIHDYPSPLISTNPNAYVYIADPWYISNGYTIQDLTFYNGPSIAPPTSELEYNYLGCYNDTGTRAIPTQLQNVSNPQECQELAISKNAALYGVQDGGQCFIGNNINQAIQYGQAANCPTMGGPWTNQLYSTVPIPKPTYNYVGCYNDAPNRAIANEMNNVTSVYDCEQLAKQQGYTVYGLQYGGQCFGSNDINAAREYGLQTNQSECSPLGGSWTNQVYTNIDNVPPLTNINPNMPTTVDEYNYKGCYNNKDNTAIPTFRGNVTSMDQCAQLAINNQEYIFGVTNNGQCYTGNNIDQALGQGQDDATAYCGTLGSSNTYQVYIRNSTTNPIMEPAKLEDPNFYPYDPSYVASSGGGSGGGGSPRTTNWFTRDSEAVLDGIFGNRTAGKIGNFFSNTIGGGIRNLFRRRERFSNFNNNNSKYLYSLKILIIILIIILLIYMLYHMI